MAGQVGAQVIKSLQGLGEETIDEAEHRRTLKSAAATIRAQNAAEAIREETERRTSINNVLTQMLEVQADNQSLEIRTEKIAKANEILKALDDKTMFSTDNVTVDFTEGDLSTETGMNASDREIYRSTVGTYINKLTESHDYIEDKRDRYATVMGSINKLETDLRKVFKTPEERKAMLDPLGTGVDIGTDQYHRYNPIDTSVHMDTHRKILEDVEKYKLEGYTAGQKDIDTRLGELADFIDWQNAFNWTDVDSEKAFMQIAEKVPLMNAQGQYVELFDLQGNQISTYSEALQTSVMYAKANQPEDAKKWLETANIAKQWAITNLGRQKEALGKAKVMAIADAREEMLTSRANRIAAGVAGVGAATQTILSIVEDSSLANEVSVALTATKTIPSRTEDYTLWAKQYEDAIYRLASDHTDWNLNKTTKELIKNVDAHSLGSPGQRLAKQKLAQYLRDNLTEVREIDFPGYDIFPFNKMFGSGVDPEEKAYEQLMFSLLETHNEMLLYEYDKTVIPDPVVTAPTPGTVRKQVGTSAANKALKKIIK